MTYKIEDIAKKIIAKARPEYGDVITNMKLQKILYYMQGFHLAMFEEPLFSEDIEAWMYGPVVPSVYDSYKESGNSPITNDEDYTPIKLQGEEEELFDQVYEAYGQFSALKLMQMTHNEIPWKSVPTGYGSVISKEVIKKYFDTQVEN